MAESRLKVILETSGTGKIKSARTSVDLLKKAVQGLDAALKKTIPLQDRVARGFTNLKAKALGAARGIKSAAQSLSSLQGVLGGIAVGALFKSAIDEATKYEAAILRITRLESEFKNLAGLQNLAAESAKNLFVSQTQAAQGYANLASRIGSSVGSVKELQAVYEGLEIVLLKNAKTTQEAASLQLQLNQALGKGTLNGDEFRSIAENAPEILRQLAKDAGVAESAIKDLASEGFVTTEKLIKALANLRNSGIDDFNALLETNLGKVRKYDKAVSDLQLTIGQELLPVFTPLIEALTFIAKAFVALPAPIKRFLVALTGVLAVVSVLAPLIAGLTIAVVVLGGKFLVAAGLVTALVLALFELPNVLRQVANEFAFVGQFFQDVWAGFTQYLSDTWIAICNLTKRAWEATMEFLLSALNFFGFGSGEVFEDVGNAWNAMVDFMGGAWAGMLNGAAEQLKKFGLLLGTAVSNIPGPIGDFIRLLGGLGSIELPKFEVEGGLKELDLDFKGSGDVLESDEGKAAKARKQKEKDKKKELQQNAKLLLQQDKLRRSSIEALLADNQYLQERLTKGQEFADLMKDIRALMDKGVDFNSAFDLVTLNKELKEAVSETEKLEQQMEDLKQGAITEISNAIQDGLVAGLEAAITGAKDFGETMRQIASDLLKSLGKMFLNAGFKGLQTSFFAEGGYVTGPTPAVVGEGGEPEYIIPSSKMNGAMARYSAGARGEGVIDGPTPSRGGGMAVAEAPMSINISGGITQIGGEEFVRKDQLPAIVAQASKAGEARTMRRLQMNPGARRKIGI